MFIVYFSEFICLGRDIFKGGEVKGHTSPRGGWGWGGRDFNSTIPGCVCRKVKDIVPFRDYFTRNGREYIVQEYNGWSYSM